MADTLKEVAVLREMHPRALARQHAHQQLEHAVKMRLYEQAGDALAVVHALNLGYGEGAPPLEFIVEWTEGDEDFSVEFFSKDNAKAFASVVGGEWRRV